MNPSFGKISIIQFAKASIWYKALLRLAVAGGSVRFENLQFASLYSDFISIH